MWLGEVHAVCSSRNCRSGFLVGNPRSPCSLSRRGGRTNRNPHASPSPQVTAAVTAANHRPSHQRDSASVAARMALVAFLLPYGGQNPRAETKQLGMKRKVGDG